MPIAWIIIAGSLALNVVVYASFVVRERIVVAGAIRTERNAGVVMCNARVAAIETAHNDKVRKGVDEARRAGDLINATPEDKQALIELCNKSASCRSRGAF